MKVSKVLTIRVSDKIQSFLTKKKGGELRHNTYENNAQEKWENNDFNTI